MRMLISVLLLLFFASLSAYLARQRGRDPVAWFMIGILLGIFAPLLLILLKPLQMGDEDKEEIETIRSSSTQVQESPAQSYLNKEWFFVDENHQQQGPVNFDQLKVLWQENKITLATYVWSQGMSQWIKIEDLPDITEALEVIP